MMRRQTANTKGHVVLDSTYTKFQGSEERKMGRDC